MIALPSVKGWLKKNLIDSYGGKCQYCEKPGTTMDHIIPLSKGGLRDASNLTLACERCNGAKGDTLLPEEQEEKLLEQAGRRVLWMGYLLTLRRFDYSLERGRRRKIGKVSEDVYNYSKTGEGYEKRV